MSWSYQCELTGMLNGRKYHTFDWVKAQAAVVGNSVVVANLPGLWCVVRTYKRNIMYASKWEW